MYPRGTFIHKNNSAMLKSNVEIKEKTIVDETIGEHIGYDLGVKMVKDYFDTHGEGGAQFVGKNILQDILAQPGCIGINIYKALNEKGDKTYVLVGLDKANNPILEIAAVNSDGQLSQIDGIVADRNKLVRGWFEL
jgi:hypothetical protein